jgi:hypothetical protein
MRPDFLNSREDAILVWTVVSTLVIVGLLSRDPRVSAWSVVRAFLTPKLVVLFGSAALYAAGVVLAAERIGLWHTTALKETVYWFIGSGVVLVTKAVEATASRAYLRQVARKAIGLTIIIEFVANFYTLPLGYELVLVPLVVVLALGEVVASELPRARPASKMIDRTLAGIGLLVLGIFAFRVIFDPGALFTRETAESFLVVPVLTLALIPYLLGVAWYSRRDVAIIRRRSRPSGLTGVAERCPRRRVRAVAASRGPSLSLGARA